MSLTYVRIIENSSVDDYIINSVKIPHCSDVIGESLAAIRNGRSLLLEGERTVMLSSDETSHSRSWQLILGAEPESVQSWEAFVWSRTVAKTVSPRARICLTHSRPMPLLAPITIQIAI